MSKKSSLVVRRTWNLLRLALLWARKGGLFRDRLSVSLSALGKLIRKLLHSNESHGALLYGDREFSFGETPIIRVKMHRPSRSLRFKMPCIKPPVDFDFDEEITNGDALMAWGTNFLKDAEEEEEEEEEEGEINGVCDEAIDLKAEEFIAKFYEQMKMQSQISYISTVQ